MGKKAIRLITAAIAAIGLFVAVCTANDSHGELTLRLAGVLMFTIGVLGYSATEKEKEGQQ